MVGLYGITSQKSKNANRRRCATGNHGGNAYDTKGRSFSAIGNYIAIAIDMEMAEIRIDCKKRTKSDHNLAR